MPSLKILPSLLSANFGKFQDEIDRLEPYIEGFHFDVMDYQFVPNLTMGAPILKKLHTNTVFDVHLMVMNPENLIDDLHQAGADMISFHVEASGTKTPEIIRDIQSRGMKAAVAIKPKTPLSEIEHVLEMVDYVLVMSVEPGFGGQSFMPEVLPKVKTLRERFPHMEIEIDGGINDTTAPLAKDAGANMLVAGSYIFGAENAAEAIQKLR